MGSTTCQLPWARLVIPHAARSCKLLWDSRFWQLGVPITAHRYHHSCKILNELRPAPEAFARLSSRLLSGPDSAHHGALVPRPYRHYRTLSEPCRPPLAEYLYQLDWSQLKLRRSSGPPPGPKPCCFGETFQEPPSNLPS